MPELPAERPEPSDVGATAQRYNSIAALEKDRLHVHPIERELTLDTILTHLDLDTSSRKLKIADIGGATGAYAFKLVDIAAASPAGAVELHLRDISTSLLALAQQEQNRRLQRTPQNSAVLASIAHGSALDPALFPEDVRGTFDAVMLLGPLYHLVQKSERVLALKNALQLLRGTSGVVFAAFVCRHAHLRDIVVRDPGRLVTDAEFYQRYLATGAYVRTGPTPADNRSSYHVESPHEVHSLVEEAGGRVIELVGVESILGGGLEAKLVDADEEVVKAWVGVLRQFSRDYSNLGAADHWLAVVAPHT
ncbi:hypothetical protein AURDEDRAFT_166466 [Auricularia subglabra TFB-10046 SS5]|nr:hypothetical protein AURDEDRAFT_166466 [Auricularia subglabra TFB-10046 SS5]